MAGVGWGGAVARALYSLVPPQPISEPTVYPGVHGGGSSRMGEPLQPAASLHLRKSCTWLRTEHQIDSWERLLGWYELRFFLTASAEFSITSNTCTTLSF